MVTIRLSRGGAKKRPFYSIVVTDSRKRRDSGYIERIGYFNPVAKAQETGFFIETERYEHWLDHGAQPSERVAHLVNQHSRQAE